MQAQYNQLAEQARKQAEENNKKQQEMMKIIEKKNYESHFPIPKAIRDHNRDHPYSFNIQVEVLFSVQILTIKYSTWYEFRNTYSGKILKFTYFVEKLGYLHKIFYQIREIRAFLYS